MTRNRIIFIACLVLLALALLLTNSAAAVAGMVMLVVAAAGSVLWGRANARRTHISFSLQTACTVDQELAMEIAVSRPAVLRSPLSLVFECHNLVTGAVTQVPVTLAPAAMRHERFNLPMDTSCCGHVSVRLVQARCADPLGLASCAAGDAFLDASYTVYPQVIALTAAAARTQHAHSAGATYDAYRTGQDRSEVLDLRTYQEGDSLKDVHWKLSSRFDDLMVREPSHPADYDIVLLCDAHACDGTDPAQTQLLNATMSMTASVSLSLLGQGMGHAVAYRNGQRLCDEPVENRAGFDRMLDALMAVPLSADSLAGTAPFEAYRRTHNVAKTVLITDAPQRDALQGLGSMTNLSVLYVNDDGLQGSADGDYLLVQIPASSVDDGLKAVEF